MDGTRGRDGRLREIEKVGFIAKLSIGEMAAQNRGTLAAAIAERRDRRRCRTLRSFNKARNRTRVKRSSLAGSS
jgi:hypothetical protein